MNEAVTAGFGIRPRTRTARPHDRINNTGGSIGHCLPCAVAISGDGSAIYTIQSLWTMARERRDVTVIILANRGCRILRQELGNLGVPQYGRNAARMFDVEDPALDFVALARGHGVPGQRVETGEALVEALAAAHRTPRPSLVEAVLPPVTGPG